MLYRHGTSQTALSQRTLIRDNICGKKQKCLNDDLNYENVVIIGDSHGLDGFNIMKTAYPLINFMDYSLGGCPPFETLDGIVYANKKCADYNDNLWHKINKIDNLKNIVISIRLSEKRYSKTISLVKKLKHEGYNVTVLGVGPFYKSDVLDILTGVKSYAEADEKIQKYIQSEIFGLNKNFKNDIEKLGVNYIDKLSILCPDNRCRCVTSDKSALMVYDKHHLSLAAAIEVGQMVQQVYPDLFK
jgi:hypothetical protein